jgi:hypothetical protein
MRHPSHVGVISTETVRRFSCSDGKLHCRKNYYAIGGGSATRIGQGCALERRDMSPQSKDQVTRFLDSPCAAFMMLLRFFYDKNSKH